MRENKRNMKTFAEILGVVKRVFYFCNVEMAKRSSLRNLSGYVKEVYSIQKW